MFFYPCGYHVCLPLTEHKVKVVTSLEWQNGLISSCHGHLSESIESVASSGHLGKN